MKRKKTEQTMLDGFGTPTVDVAEATLENLAYGTGIEKINAALRRAGVMMADEENYPIGSEFKIAVQIVLTRTDAQGSVEATLAVRVIAPDLRKVGTKIFIDGEGGLHVPVAPPTNGEARTAADDQNQTAAPKSTRSSNLPMLESKNLERVEHVH